MPPKNPASLKRNDVPSAVKFFADHVRAGTWRTEYGQQLYMLQDDPAELAAALRSALDDSPGLEEKLRRIPGGDR